MYKNKIIIKATRIDWNKEIIIKNISTIENQEDYKDKSIFDVNILGF